MLVTRQCIMTEVCGRGNLLTYESQEAERKEDKVPNLLQRHLP
jgi:hypothetical protein